MRRLSEICGVDVASIEPDPRFVGPAAWPGGQGVALLEREGDAPSAGAPTAAPPPPAPREPKAAAQGTAPADLAAARAKEARAPIDRTAYKIVRTAAELSAWIARAEDEGVVAIDAETNSPDPLQGELIGLSLAVKPGEACYIPIGHRTGADDLFEGGGLAPGSDCGKGSDRAPEAAARAARRPQGRPRPQVRYACARDARRSGRADRRCRCCSPTRSTPARPATTTASIRSPRAFSDISRCRSARSQAPAARSSGSRARRSKRPANTARSKRTSRLRLRRVLTPRIVAERMTTVYERLERPLVEVLARMERRGISIDRNILSRMTGEFSQRMARARSRDQRNCRRTLQPRLAEAAWRHSVRQDGPARRQEDRDRRLVDHRAACSRTSPPKVINCRRACSNGGRSPSSNRPTPTRCRASSILDRSRPHGLRTRFDDNRAPVVVGAQPAEHSDPHRRGAQDPARLRRA